MSRLIQGLQVLVGYTAETLFDAWNYHIRRTREKKLQALLAKWEGTPRGTLVIMSVPLYVTKLRKDHHPAGGGGWVNSPQTWKPTEGHIIQPGQGAMIMSISWPTVLPNHMDEDPVRFVFWCNDDLYEWKFTLEHFTSPLPFGVLD